MVSSPIRAKAATSLLLFLFISSMGLGITLSTTSDESSSIHSPIQREISFDESQGLGTGIFENESFKQSIIDFVTSAQDNGIQNLPSMDSAYHLGMSFYYLDAFAYAIPSNMIDPIIEFVDTSRNTDGGYGNWEGARSSVESTYQAIQLLTAHMGQTNLDIVSATKTLSFIGLLETAEEGYLPLLDWDAPDVSSTYRVSYILDILDDEFPSLNILIDNSSTIFLDNAFVPPIFVNGASGYSENIGGDAELLASLDAVQGYVLHNYTEVPNMESVAKFLDSLITINGGVAGYLGGLPTTGYTSAAIQLYLLVKTQTSFDIDSYLSPTFLDDAINYLLANRIAGSGFGASERDLTPELSSTFFSLRALYLLDSLGFISSIPDLTGVYNYLLDGIQPTYAYADYPGDVPDVSYTTYAVLIGNLLGNTSWIYPVVHEYINNAYSTARGGFGFRPSSTARVKYTYFGIRALRSMNDPLVTAPDIVQFILNSQNIDGGFGEQPSSSISYLTHTYWSIMSLQLLGNLENSQLDSEGLLNWLFYLRKPDGTFSNYPGFNSSLVSTYRAMMIQQYMGITDIDDGTLNATLMDYMDPSGGYIPSQNRLVPTMEDTFYGVSLALLLGQELDREHIQDFVLSLQNADGGFGLRPGFSSRLESSYYALLILRLLELGGSGQPIVEYSENPLDIFSPILLPAFIPDIENNKEFQNSFILTATIKEPESAIQSTWVEAIWSRTNEGLETFQFIGEQTKTSEEYSYLMGTFDEVGILQFRIHVVDENENTAVSEWFYLRSLSVVLGGQTGQFDVSAMLLQFSVPIFMGVGITDGLFIHRKKKKSEKSDVRMTISYETKEGTFGNESLNIIGLFLIMGTIAILARVFLPDAILVAENSIFLFRFLVGMMVILFAKYVLGIKALGLFGPTVLVIAMLSVGPLWGLIIFLDIFAVGFVVRSMISRFNFAVGFRIGILMIFTITFIGLLELLGEIFLIPTLGGTILVPIIITPWFIDRYVIEAEQKDQLEAFKRLVITLGVTLVAYIFMSYDPLIRALVVNPELWLVLTAITVYGGRSSNYSFKDKARFDRFFKKEEEPLSIQIRNRDYIAKYNSKVLFPILNKFMMKEQFEKWRVPTPELLAVVDSESQIAGLMDRLENDEEFKNGFVIKPSQSFGGKGIVVVKERTEDGNFIISGEVHAPIALETEIRKILQGEYLTSQTLTDRDIVLIEEKIVSHPDIAKISTGLPDVRVIVFRGIPVLAMMRLSTKDSQGKANLKQGAIGAALRMSDGEIYRAEIKGVEVERHPDTGEKIVGFKLKKWLEILSVACLAQKSSGLGYAGVDIVIGDDDRVLLLEVNKRPGLEIQNVTQSSLLRRFEDIENEDLDATELSPIRAARMGIDLARERWEKEEV